MKTTKPPKKPIRRAPGPEFFTSSNTTPPPPPIDHTPDPYRQQARLLCLYWAPDKGPTNGR